jgi:hypothetical protein
VATDIFTLCCAVSGPVTGAIWFLNSLATEKRTRKIVAEELNKLIDVKLSKFKSELKVPTLADLKDELNGPKGFRRSESCDLMMKPVDDHERRIRALETAIAQGQ